MSSEERFDYRFSYFKDRPWYESTKYNIIETLSEYDDGGEAVRNAERVLLDLAKAEGIDLPPPRCWTCNTAMPIDRSDGEECTLCIAVDEANREWNDRERARREAWLASLTPEQLAEYMRLHPEPMLCIAGLLKRDVQ